jgi:hypothetical protein
MNNKEKLVLVLLLVLIIVKILNSREDFGTNNYPCVSNPTNSNCTCPSEAPSQTVFGKFPMNYGKTSPYLYSCVSDKVSEPPTNVYPNPPE